MDIDVAPAGETVDSAPITSIPVSNDEPISARDAANAVAQFRYKQDAKQERESAAEEPAAPQVSEEENAAPAEEATGEPTQEAEPEEFPPIEPPRSWTKEEKDEFKSYPREAQEKIARREQDRESALRRGQNETAEQRKAVEAERQKVEQARQQYEAALPALLQTVKDAQAGEFADIKTQADVDRLASEDWPRFAKYQAHLMKVGSLEHEVQAAQQRQAQEYQVKWAEFSSAEDAKFLDAVPEMADKTKATKIADDSIAMLKAIGFSEKELADTWQGSASVSMRDSRVQQLIYKAAKYDAAQAAAKKAIAKPVPQVQRPGAARPRGADADLKITNLDKQLERTGNWKDAAEALIARRKAAR